MSLNPGSTTEAEPATIPALLPLATRVGVWALFFLLLYVLRSIFLLVFLTFVFAYIQTRGVERLAGTIHNRTVRVVLVALLILGVLVSVGAFVVPRLKAQARGFADKIPVYAQTLDKSLAELATDYPVIREMIPELAPAVSEEGSAAAGDGTVPKNSPSAALLHALFGGGEQTGPVDLRHTLTTVRNIGTSVVGVASAFLLSLLFSFLIVLDLPRLTEGARGLTNTRLGFVYDETAGTLYNFARILGRALEAQVFIALLNTVLTAICLQILGLGEETIFLSVIVFFCSFIPVAGVFISSVPICLLALQQGGVANLVFAILLIWGIHLVEAYVLNPRIYGHHLRMNPVLVLIVLTIAGKFFHFWGLILGVPVCTYLFGHAIHYRDSEVNTRAES